MKNISATYRVFIQAVAFFLLMAFVAPTGLHAKQLVDFCMTEIGAAPSGEAKHQANDMAADHSCCEKDTEKEAAGHPGCDWGFVCACDIGNSTLGDEEWIPVKNSFEVPLSEKETPAPFFTTSEIIPAGQQIRIGEYDPPLWLLYDTFLM